jgi:hypothetical protein
VIDAVLDHHQGALRGTFAHAVVELRPAEADPPVQALLALPDRLRLDWPDGHTEVLVEGAGWRCAGREPAVRLAGEELKALQQMRHHLRALTLAPLGEAERVERAGPGVFALVLPGGETWRLEVNEASLQIEELRGPAGAVRFTTFLSTGVTVLPRTVELPGLGTRWVSFRATDLTVLHPGLFADPTLLLRDLSDRPRATRTTALRNPAEQPAAPELQDIDGRMFLAHPDPGSWEERRRIILRDGAALDAKGQAPGGLPTYRLAEGHTELLIPFRPDPERGHPPFVSGPDDVVRHLPAHRAAVVAPPPGPWDEALERGRAMLAKYLQDNDLVTDGDLLCIPFLEVERVPDAKQREHLPLRLEQPVRQRP